MEKVEFPDEIRTLVEQFDTARAATTLLRARFRSGKSGAFVGLVDCQGHHDGVFVLKVASRLEGEQEEKKHVRALEIGAFREKIPKIIDSFQAGDLHALLLKIAGGSRINWRRWWSRHISSDRVTQPLPARFGHLVCIPLVNKNMEQPSCRMYSATD